MSQQKIDLDAFYREHASPCSRFTGQLAPGFQEALATRFQSVSREDCEFYHTMTLRGGQVVAGEWDLRGHESAQTGDYSFDGKRVIEFGPASGYLTAYLYGRGAEVTAFDLPFGAAPELVPLDGIDLLEHQRSGIRSIDRLRNSWWYAKRAIGFGANAVYGDIYNLPGDLGQFDVALFGLILLRLSNPFLALRRAASITAEAIIVTDVLSAGRHLPMPEDAQLTAPLMLFNPVPPPVGAIHWWSLSPGAIRHMLSVFGFMDIKVTIHAPLAGRPAFRLFTVVARRNARH